LIVAAIESTPAEADLATLWAWVAAHRAPLGLALWGVVVAALAAAVAPVLRHRRRRRAAWLTNPEELLTPPPRPAALLAPARVLAGIGGAAGGALRAPFPVWAAAAAILTIYHQMRWTPAAWVGLLLIGGGVAAAGDLWLAGPAWHGPLRGLLLAALALLVAGRYWSGQLLDGAAWTTAGRLAPRCAVVALALLAGAVAVAALGWRAVSAGESVSAWQAGGSAGLAAVVRVVAGYLSAGQMQARGGWAVCLAMAALVLIAPGGAGADAPSVLDLLKTAAVGGVFVALLGRRLGASGRAAVPYHACLVVALPAAVVAGLVLQRSQLAATPNTAAVAAIAALAAVLVWLWPRRRLTAVGRPQ